MSEKNKTNLIKKHIKIGDLITHNCCMGAISEHIFTRWDGYWMCGKPTSDTMKYNRCDKREINDIAPSDVTHINRELVENIDFIIDFRKQ